MATAGVIPDGLCRECFRLSPDPSRCRHCGSPLLISHPERDSLGIAHIDCDAFFAAIEKRDAPELVGRPVIVGGGRRGVVSTCCYVARTYGVRSAMPMFKALAACPDAIVIRPNMEKYRLAARQVKQAMLALTPLVESLSIDEAFLDLSGTERLHGCSPATSLARLQATIRHDIGITVSVGLSHNKFLAKIASDLDKPNGFSVIGREETVAFLAAQPVGTIWGVGAVMQKRLASEGIIRIADLQALDRMTLLKRHGQEGDRFHNLAMGLDTRPVLPGRDTKSVSAETTFDSDVADVEALSGIAWRLSEKVAQRLREAELAAGSVTLKLKTKEFRLLTRSRSGLPPTQLARRLHAAILPLLETEARGRVPYRLLGVGAGDLKPAADADRGDLMDLNATRDVAEARAVETLRTRFGAAAISYGITLEQDRKG